jgi:HK97 family phage major capsid protein
VKSLELKRKRESLLAEMDVLANKASLTAEENSRWAELKSLVDGVGNEIRTEEEKENHMRLRAAESGKKISRGEENDIQSYSLLKALREYVNNGRLTGIEAEMHQEAAGEMKNINGLMGLGISQKVLSHKVITRSTLVAASGPTVPTVKVGFIDALYARLVLTRLGAQTLSGLTSNVDFPLLSTAPTVAWAAENDAASDAGAALNKVSLTPHRLTNFIPISKLLLIQDAVGIEERLWNTFIEATIAQLQYGVINGGSNAPTGILATSNIGSVAGGTNGAAPTLAHILSLIKAVAIVNADIGSLGFLTSPMVRWKLQNTNIATGYPQMVWDLLQNDSLLGYKVGVTTSSSDTLTKGGSGAVCSSIIFGNFNDLTIGQFGALDLTVDPYTGAKSNLINLILNGFYDAAVMRPASFAAMKDALASS